MGLAGAADFAAVHPMCPAFLIFRVFWELSHMASPSLALQGCVEDVFFQN